MNINGRELYAFCQKKPTRFARYLDKEKERQSKSTVNEMMICVNEEQPNAHYTAPLFTFTSIFDPNSWLEPSSMMRFIYYVYT